MSEEKKNITCFYCGASFTVIHNGDADPEFCVFCSEQVSAPNYEEEEDEEGEEEEDDEEEDDF